MAISLIAFSVTGDDEFVSIFTTTTWPNDCVLQAVRSSENHFIL